MNEKYYLSFDNGYCRIARGEGLQGAIDDATFTADHLPLTAKIVDHSTLKVVGQVVRYTCGQRSGFKFLGGVS
jgi:hypothetical protein